MGRGVLIAGIRASLMVGAGVAAGLSGIPAAQAQQAPGSLFAVVAPQPLPPALRAAVTIGNPVVIVQVVQTLSGGNPATVAQLSTLVAAASATANPATAAAVSAALATAAPQAAAQISASAAQAAPQVAAQIAAATVRAVPQHAALVTAAVVAAAPQVATQVFAAIAQATGQSVAVVTAATNVPGVQNAVAAVVAGVAHMVREMGSEPMVANRAEVPAAADLVAGEGDAFVDESDDEANDATVVPVDAPGVAASPV